MDFPTVNAYQSSVGGGYSDVFVAKLSFNESLNTLALEYATYLGGADLDDGRSIAVDQTGSAYVTGYTECLNFPIVNAFQPTYGGTTSTFCSGDAFVAKLSPSGSTLVYSTYLGGNCSDFGNGIAVDQNGSSYVTGYTMSTSTTFPLSNAYQTTHSGGEDVFIAKLSPDGSALVYSTYLGGRWNDRGSAIPVDSAGDAYVTGGTGYTLAAPFFPTANAWEPSHGGGFSDAFVARLSFNESLNTLTLEYPHI